MVKGWNHVHAQHLTAPEVNGIAASVLVGMMLFVRLGPLRVLSPS